MSLAAATPMRSAPVARRWQWQGAKPVPAIITFALGVILYFGLPAVAPAPPAAAFGGSVSAATPRAPVVEHPTPAQQAAAASAEAKRHAEWRRGLHLFAIFITTIVGIVLRPLPMGSVAMAGITLVGLTGTLSVGEAFSGFNNKTIWLIGLAFFIARAFVKTGLGSRIAYFFMRSWESEDTRKVRETLIETRPCRVPFENSSRLRPAPFHAVPSRPTDRSALTAT